MTSSEPRPFRVGLLGHGTVGSAFATLLAARAAQIELTTGLRPELSGVLTRSRGTFEEIVEGSDLVVEVIGGLEPAREYVLRAMQAGRHVVTANKQLLSQHGEELWAVAREHGVQLRFEGAVAGVIPVVASICDARPGSSSANADPTVPWPSRPMRKVRLKGRPAPGGRRTSRAARPRGRRRPCRRSPAGAAGRCTCWPSRARSRRSRA